MSTPSAQLRVADTNSAFDFQGSLGPIHYKYIWIVLAALALSLALLLVLSVGSRMTFGILLLIASIPLVLALGFTWICQTQPPGYLADLIEGWFVQPAFGLEPIAEPSE